MADSGRKSHSHIPKASAQPSLVAIAMPTLLLLLITFLPLCYQTAEFGWDTAKMGNLEIVELLFVCAATSLWQFAANNSVAAETILV